MTSRERVIAALTGTQQPDKVPFMELGIDYGIAIQLLEKEDYTWEELADCLKLDGYGTGVYPNLYVKQQEINGRSIITDGNIKERSDFEKIKLIDPNDPALYESFKRLVENNKHDRAIFGATNMGLDPLLLNMGMEGFAYACMDDIKLVEEHITLYTEWAIEVVKNLQKEGADIIWFTDDIAFNTGLMFRPEFFEEIARPRLQKVIDACSVPIIYHSDGNVVPVINSLIEMGINGIHPMDPTGVDIHEVKKMYGDSVCLLGNIDLRHTLIDAPLEEVRAEVKDRIETIGKGGRYIICSANSITDYCKKENVLAMRNAIQEFGWY